MSEINAKWRKDTIGDLSWIRIKNHVMESYLYQSAITADLKAGMFDYLECWPPE